MKQDRSTAATKRSRPAAARQTPSDRTGHSVATLEEFDREHMGIAAKE